ncbi:MAG: TRAP transporter small permease subunit [Betaproteobacteria bacterium]|nr:MAG: TRAP transporter small permease subunit [Betaproteobacteria bacterium]
MRALITMARIIDQANERLGRIAVWLVLIACVVSAGNAVSRYALDLSSNAWLELQWYLFTAMVLLGAPFVLSANGHVRVDILYGRAEPRTRAWIDLLGLVFFLLPMAALIAFLAWPFFVESFLGGETSSNAGGLLRWPVKLLLPVGFGLLFLQGVAEIIKRIAYLRGMLDLDSHYEKPLQ